MTLVLDNVEAFSVLNLKSNFYDPNFKCRICNQSISNIEKTIDEEIILKDNYYYYKQFKLSILYKEISKINGIIAISPFINIENFNYLFSVVVEPQHCECEGEMKRTLILLFLKFPNLKDDSKMENLLNFLETNYKIDKNKLKNFMEEIENMKDKVFKQPQQPLQNNQIKQFKTKKNLIGSNEISYFFISLVIFFYDFFKSNINNDVIKIFIIHFNYYKLLFKNSFFEEDLDLLNFLVKERIKIMIKIHMKIVPKTLFTIHYGLFIKALGPIKFFSSFIIENHNHTVKFDICKCTKNIGVTCLFNNYCFFTYNRNIYIPAKSIYNKDFEIVSFIRISNHLIIPKKNAIFIGNFIFINLFF